MIPPNHPALLVFSALVAGRELTLGGSKYRLQYDQGCWRLETGHLRIRKTAGGAALETIWERSELSFERFIELACSLKYKELVHAVAIRREWKNPWKRKKEIK